MTFVDAITLFDREDGTRSMKLGRHDDRILDGENTIASEQTEIVELGEPVPKTQILSNWGDADFPDRVQEFFNVGEAA